MPPPGWALPDARKRPPTFGTALDGRLKAENMPLLAAP